MSRALGAEFEKLRAATARLSEEGRVEASALIAVLRINVALASEIRVADAIAAVRAVRERIEALPRKVMTTP